MLSTNASMILGLLRTHTAMDGPDIEEETGLDEKSIKAAAVELRNERLITTNGASDGNEDSGMAIDRLKVTLRGERVHL